MKKIKLHKTDFKAGLDTNNGIIQCNTIVGFLDTIVGVIVIIIPSSVV